jgi:carbamate kinase
VPLDVQAAETQGGLGYAIQQALEDRCRAQGLPVPVVVLITRVVVDPADPAFARPSWRVGPPYPKAAARRLERQRGWRFVEDGRRGFRRVVPAPRPARVVGDGLVRTLVEDGVLPVVGGGGGIPVAATAEGYRGVEAVIDPDLTAMALAQALGADRLLLLTGVPRVAVNFGTPRAITIERLGEAEARALLAAGEFPSASMGVKVEASLAFLAAGGREAIITTPDQARAAVDGEAGTHLTLA